MSSERLTATLLFLVTAGLLAFAVHIPIFWVLGGATATVGIILLRRDRNAGR